MTTQRYAANADGTLTVESLTPEQIAAMDRVLCRVAAFLHEHLSEHPLDAAACCLVVAARIVEVLQPAGVTLEHLQTFARSAATIRGAPELTGFARPRGALVVASAPDEELRELTRLLWLLVRESLREEHAPDLCQCIGILLQVAWALAGRSLQVTPSAFEHAAGLAWTFCDAWMPPIEAEREAA